MKLQKRERLLVFVGAPIVVITLLYQFVLSDRLDEFSMLRETVPARHQDLNEAKKICSVLTRRRANAEALRNKIASRGSGFDAFVFLKSIAQQAKLRDRHDITLQNLRGSAGSEFSPKAWKVVLKGVKQVEIGEFLRRVYESDQLLHVSEFTITPEKNINGLHAEITVLTLFNK